MNPLTTIPHSFCIFWVPGHYHCMLGLGGVESQRPKSTKMGCVPSTALAQHRKIYNTTSESSLQEHSKEPHVKIVTHFSGKPPTKMRAIFVAHYGNPESPKTISEVLRTHVFRVKKHFCTSVACPYLKPFGLQLVRDALWAPWHHPGQLLQVLINLLLWSMAKSFFYFNWSTFSSQHLENVVRTTANLSSLL